MSNSALKTAVTRDDVAKACGVSGALVSYALNPAASSKVKPETRKRILETACKLGYRLNFSGRALKTNRSYNIAIVLPEKFADSVSLHHLRIFHGICHSINQTDYRPMIFFGINDKFFNTIRDRRVDGIIVQDSTTRLDYIEELLRFGLPLVLSNVDYPVPADAVAGWVRSDHERMVDDGTAKLVAAGCRLLIVVSCSPDLCQPNQRLNQAFEALLPHYTALGVRGIMLNPNHADWRSQLRTAFREGGETVGFLVDGVVFVSDIMAAAREYGVGLEQNRNLFITESNPLETGVWIHDSKQIGRRSWAMMSRLLRQEKGERFEKVPFLLLTEDTLSQL